MEIKILKFELRPCRTKVADLLIQYESVIFRCELTYYTPSNRPWIRMPEIWTASNHKYKFAYWPTKEISDEFQKTVLDIIFKEFDLNENAVAALHTQAVEKSKNKKKCKND